MAILPDNSDCLELTISIPGLSSSLPFHASDEGHVGGSGGRSHVGGGGSGAIKKDFDINQIPTASAAGGEEECMEEEDDEENESPNGGPPRKKLRLTKEQSRLLEESFRQNHTLNPKQKEALAMQLKLKARQVEVWFQNRRARSKLKQTEMECEYLKRWFGSLTEQNRRLQKEVEELRAMKVGPPTVISPHNCQPLPASTLTMCPRCERVTTTTTTATTTTTDMTGPTTISSSTTSSTNPTLSTTKSSILHPGRHPSAAC